MREHLIVSGRGQVTLPASIRNKYGIGPGDVMILDDQSGQMVLKPSVVVEVEIYTDEQVRQWDEEDQLTEPERARVLSALGHKA